MNKFFFILLFIFINIEFTYGSDFEKVCQPYLKNKCVPSDSIALQALTIKCQIEYQKNECDNYTKKITEGLSGSDFDKMSKRVIGCSIRDICEVPVIEGVKNCAQAVLIDVPIGILTSPFAAMEFIGEAFQKDKNCFQDIAGKAELIEKFNQIVTEKEYKLDGIFLSGEFLANISCSDLNKLIHEKKKRYQAYIGPLVAQGKITSPFQNQLDFPDLVKRGFNNIKQHYQCLRPEIQSEFYCELAAYAVLGKFGTSHIRNLEFRKILEAKSFAGPLNNAPKYRTISMLEKYVGEENGIKINNINMKPQYLSREQIKKYEVEVVAGKLVYRDSKQLVDTNGRNAIYVMDENGRIYAGLPRQGGKYHHSSYLSGGDVSAAGEIQVNNGIIQKIDRTSGHYKPSPTEFNQVILELKNRGVMLKPQNIDFAVKDL